MDYRRPTLDPQDVLFTSPLNIGEKER
jgi:hypothetical protein